MADFSAALRVVLAHEGGYTDDPLDHGGPTRFGVTQGTLDAAREHFPGLPATTRELTPEQAAGVYRVLWWDKYAYGSIVAQDVATKVFDAAVNMGPRRAHRIAQIAASRAGHEVVCDGVFGPGTLSAVNACDPAEWLRRFCAEQADYYCRIIAADPTQARFRRGWLARAAWPVTGVA